MLQTRHILRLEQEPVSIGTKNGKVWLQQRENSERDNDSQKTLGVVTISGTEFESTMNEEDTFSRRNR